MRQSFCIGVVGLWHLGEVYSACLAELDHKVVGIDADTKVVQNLEQNIPPLAEPGLAELLTKHHKTGRLSYTTDFSQLKECDTVWLTLDTPVKDTDEADLNPIWKLIEASIPHFKYGVFVVVSSQLPVGTSVAIIARIKAARPELAFTYAYSPENLRLGDAVNCFMRPGRVVVGTEHAEGLEKFKDILAPLSTEIVSTKIASAEIAKHALNAFLATSISFTNDLADVCEQYGADIEQVIPALKSDPRVGPKAYLFAGLGFSGGTLGRDLQALMASARAHNGSLPVIEGVHAKNQSRNAVVPARLTKTFGSVAGKKLALFGVTYKAGTSTLRRSQPLEVEQELRSLGAVISLYDPLAIPEEVAARTPSRFTRDLYEAAKGADAILIMTASKDMRTLDFAKLKRVMKGDLLFDTCNILYEVKSAVESAGFTYLSIGA